MDELDDLTFELGMMTLPVGGVTTEELNIAIADRAPASATYITQTASDDLSAEQSLGSLATGILKNTTTTGVLSIATGSDLPTHTHSGVTVGGGFLIDGGGAVITTGIKGDLEIPFAGTITRVRVFQDQSGSIAVSGWKDTLANYPPTVADLIYTVTVSGSAVPGDSGAVSIAVAAGDIIRHNVNSVTTITRATVAYTITRTV